jgi:hypothetical protein
MSAKRVQFSLLALHALAGVASAAEAPADPLGLLGFETKLVEGLPCGWSATPRDTAFADDAVKRSGTRALRVERGPGRKDKFTSIARGAPVDFAGQAVELRGQLRADGGNASLWLRQDAEKQLDFVGGEAVPTTSGWVAQSINAKLHPAARNLVFGLRYTGTGKAWVDDFELLIDGEPIAIDAAYCTPTVLDEDHEFDRGSGIELRKLSDAQLDSLVLTAKVWGFLKYHHPVLTAGKRHWDYALLRQLPKILAAGSWKETQSILLDWIDSLGVVPPCDTACAKADSQAPVQPRLHWIDDHRLLGRELSTRLRSIHTNRIANRQFFVGLGPGVGNATFDNDPAYQEISFPDSGFQILALLRFWNMVEYWFPYRELIDESWDVVLRESLAALAAGMSRQDFELGMKALVARADDGHANLYIAPTVGPPTGECQLPVSLRYLEGQFVVESLTADTEEARLFRAGDVLTTLDGNPVGQIVAQVRRYHGASNEPARMREIARALTRGDCGSVRVGILRDRAVELEARRVPREALSLDDVYRNDRPGATFQMLSSKIAYLKLSSIKVADVPKYITEASSSAEALIVDIRNYPAEFVVFALGSLLVDEATPFATFTAPSLSNPGMFVWAATPRLTAAQPHFPGRVAILVDEHSQSQAEYTAMALRASPRAIIAGSQTAGADGNVTLIPLPGGLRASMSGLGVFYPDRKRTQQRGVAIDVPCSATIAGIQAGRDEILECALRALGVDAGTGASHP